MAAFCGQDPGLCAGLDEVGRGSLFGPVFAGAVMLPAQALAPLAALGLTDSKDLSAGQRQRLVPQIHALAFAWALGQASAAEIDRRGIRWATEAAMLRALQRLPSTPALLLVDGVLPLRNWSAPQVTLVHGDRRCLAIAAASVLAKQARDALIQRLAERYTGYGLERNAGYGTAVHRQAILRIGPTALHRQSFLRRLLSAPGTSA
ncbi:ribonuclease HII [Synechococcus sp. CS-1324]|nr:ribonuclease HII [Synechococcus sp. CS-1324]PZV06288.1 MAG: ribonuclease HII [Cyanobium sp.]